MFKVNKVYAAIVQTQNGSHLFLYAAFWRKKRKKERKKQKANKQKKIPYATAFSYCFITNLQRSCITLFYTN